MKLTEHDGFLANGSPDGLGSCWGMRVFELVGHGSTLKGILIPSILLRLGDPAWDRLALHHSARRDKFEEHSTAQGH